MRAFFALMLFALVAMPAGASFAQTKAPAPDPENTLLMKLKDGTVTIRLRPDLAPNHVKRLKELTREGKYDGVVFHRVIGGFMAQTGDVEFGKTGAPGFDPSRAGMGGSDKPDLKAEFSDVPFERGIVGMARSSDPDSANSQFFIMFGSAPSLNGQYTVVGQVVDGMTYVDDIKKGDRSQNGSVSNPDKIVKMTVAADAKQ